MSFVWPQMLFGLLAVPVLAAAYMWWTRRAQGARRRLGGLAQTDGPGRGILRHLPPALFLLALALLLVAVGRPAAVVNMPSRHETVVLAVDVSGSMRATDVQPTRLAAAQEAAKAFIDGQPRSTRIGIVTFAGVASLVQPPTDDREEVRQAIDRFQPQRGTAVGSAIVVSLATIFPNAGITIQMLQPPRAGAGSTDPSRESRRDAASGRPQLPGGKPAPFEPVPAGSFDSAVIVLLSDGQSTTGPDTMAAAKLAADRGVRIYTVGVGTAKGEVLRIDGRAMRVALDESALKTVADLTRGEYFFAGDAAELKRIYQSMNSRFVMERKEFEIGAFFAAGAALLVLLAAGLSVAWYGRVL